MLDYIDSRGKRNLLLSLVYFFFIAAVALTAYLATLFVYEWLGILVGAVLTLLAIIPHRRGKRDLSLYLLAVIMNAVGTGFAISAYYNVARVPLVTPYLLLFPIGTAALYALTNLLISRLGKGRLILTLVGVLVGLLALGGVAVWIFLSSEIGSVAFFSLLLLAFFLFVSGRTLGHPERSAMREASFGSFGAFVVTALVVIAIISEGDAVDGLDIVELDKKKKGSVKK